MQDNDCCCTTELWQDCSLEQHTSKAEEDEEGGGAGWVAHCDGGCVPVGRCLRLPQER